MYGIDDPSSLLRPWKNVKQFSEELYGMFRKATTGPATEPTAEPDKPAVENAPDKRRRDDPAGVNLGGVRKQRLADVAQARPGVSVQGKAATPADRPRTPPDGDQGTRTPSRPVEPLDPIKGGADVARKGAESTVAARPERGLPVNVGDQSSSPRVAFSQSGNSAPVAPQPAPATGVKKDSPTPRTVTATTQAPVGREKVAPSPRSSQDSVPRRYPKTGDGPKRPRRDGNDFEPLDIGDFANQVGGGGGTGSVFMGVVVSGEGDTYQVTLYQNGPKGSPDDKPVKVTIPMIDASDKIDAGTWLSSIFQFSDSDGNDIYSCQPPVWMP